MPTYLGELLREISIACTYEEPELDKEVRISRAEVFPGKGKLIACFLLARIKRILFRLKCLGDNEYLLIPETRKYVYAYA